MDLTKEFLWTSAAISGSIVAKARKSQYHKGRDNEMKNIISRLFEGEIFPAETVVSVSSEYRSAIAKMSNIIED